MTRRLSIVLVALALYSIVVAMAAGRLGRPVIRVETPPSTYHPLTDDAALLDAVDFARPDLARVAALYRAHDIKGALAALVTHFRQRARPLPPDVPPSANLGEAKAILDGRIGSGTSLPPFTVTLPYDWDSDPLNDNQTVIALNRHSFLTPLVAAYRKTGDPRYLKKAVAYLRDWMRGASEARYLEGLPIVVIGRQSLWMPRSFWQDAAERLREPWLYLFFTGRKSAALPDDAMLLMLRMIYNQAQYVQQAMLPGDDRTAIAAGTLDAVGLLFPEFKKSADWRKTARTALRGVAEHQFAPDGVHIGMAPHYELVTLRSLGRPLLLEAQNGQTPDPHVLATLTRGLDYLVGVSDPARNLPVLKISDRTPLPPLLRPLLKLFPARRGYAFIATDGREGKAPAYLSRPFPYAGQAVFRSGWDSNALYLLFDAGPMGTLPHEDKLGLEMYAYGAPLLADPGRHSYNRAPIDLYLWSSRAHSVVLVDGRGQDRASCPKSTWWPTRRAALTFWRDGDDVVAAGRFTGPWKSGAAVVHRREVRFIQDHLFLVVDRMQPEDGRPHAYDGRFQLAEGEAEARGEQVVFHAENGHAGLVIARLSSPGPTPAPIVVKGSEHPIGGWISPKYGRLVPAPSVRYASGPAVGGAMFVTALVPFRGKAPKVALDWTVGSGATRPAVRITVNSLETSSVLPLDDNAGMHSAPQAAREPTCTP